MNEIVYDIEITDLHGEQRELAEIVGLEMYLKLVKLVGGSNIYIAKEDKILAIQRDKQIKSEFDGQNFRALAIKYNLTERRIRDIIGEDYKKGVPDSQITFFE